MLAFAATELATTWGRIIKRPGTRIPMSFTLLSLWIFLSLILHWFGLWSYREVPFDTPIQSLFVLLPSVVLALVTHALSPEHVPAGANALEEHYDAVAPKVLPLAGLFVVLGSISDSVLPGVHEAPPLWIFALSGGSIAALGLTRKRIAHIVVLGLNICAAVAGLSL